MASRAITLDAGDEAFAAALRADGRAHSGDCKTKKRRFARRRFFEVVLVQPFTEKGREGLKAQGEGFDFSATKIRFFSGRLTSHSPLTTRR